MMQTKKRMPIFYIILISLWVLALGALLVACFVIRSYLADYESVQPKYVAEEVFEEYFAASNYSAILEKCDKERGPFEDDETIAEYLSSITEGKELSYHNISSGMDDSVSKYIVKYTEGENEVKIASFLLEKTEEKSEKGFAKYALSGFELFYPTEVKVSIKTLSGSVPYLNGIALDESYITEKGIEHESCDHMPEGVSGIKYDVYTVSGLACEPRVSVIASDGSELSTIINENGVYETPIPYSENLAAEQSDFVIEAAQAFASYMQNDLKLAKLSPYFEKGTNLYNSIKSTLQWAVIDHDSFSFEDVETSEFYAYDENTFSCRVRMVHVLKRGRLEDYRDTMDATFYLRKVNGSYLVYDRTNN